jgi:hypothetical protein
MSFCPQQTLFCLPGRIFFGEAEDDLDKTSDATFSLHDLENKKK